MSNGTSWVDLCFKQSSTFLPSVLIARIKPNLSKVMPVVAMQKSVVLFCFHFTNVAIVLFVYTIFHTFRFLVIIFHNLKAQS